MRYRITVLGADLHLRGYADGGIGALADDLAPAQVLASPAADTYDPFRISEPEHPPTIESSRELVRGIMGQNVDAGEIIEMFAVLHFQQANVIRGERYRAEVAESALTDVLGRALAAVDEAVLGGSQFAEAGRDGARAALKQVLIDMKTEQGPRRG